MNNAQLASQLSAFDVPHLRVPSAVADVEPLSSEQLIRQLAQHADARYHEALIPFFLRHPERSALVLDIAASLDEESAETLRHMYTAAVYLQQLWGNQIQLYLGTLKHLPNYFGQTDFNLPAPDVHFGEAGLYALADLFEEKTGYTWITVYKSAMSLLLDQLYLEAGDVW